MWVFRLRHGPQEEGPRPPPGADLLSGYAGTVSLRTARAVRGSQRHPLRTNPSMTVTPCSRYSTRSCHIQTSEHAVVVFPRRVRVAAQGIAIDVPRALPQPREGHGVQRPVRTEM